MQDAKFREMKRSWQRKAARAAGLKLAPGDLGTLQAFVNTVAHGKKGDELADVEKLGRWLVRHRLLDAGTILGETERRRALDARRGFRVLMLGNSGVEVDEEAVQRLERAAEGGRLAVRFDSGGPGGFGPASGGFDDALGALAAIVATARLEGLWPQMKLCARKGCGRAFFDASASRTGVWCSPQCGDRVRRAAHVRRKKQSPR